MRTFMGSAHGMTKPNAGDGGMIDQEHTGSVLGFRLTHDLVEEGQVTRTANMQRVVGCGNNQTTVEPRVLRSPAALAGEKTRQLGFRLTFDQPHEEVK